MSQDYWISGASKTWNMAYVLTFSIQSGKGNNGLAKILLLHEGEGIKSTRVESDLYEGKTKIVDYLYMSIVAWLGDEDRSAVYDARDEAMLYAATLVKAKEEKRPRGRPRKVI